MSPYTTPTRLRTTTSWIAWHGGELAAITLPVVLAITVTAWAWLLAVLVAAGWVWHEAHGQHRRTTRPALPPAQTTDTTAADEQDRGQHQEVRHG